MRKYFWTYILIMVMAILAILFWHHFGQHPVEPDLVSVQQITNSMAKTLVVPPTGAGVINQNSASNSVPIAPANSTQESLSEKINRVAHEFNDEHYRSIKFYGQVIDQDGNALSNAKINISILQQQMSIPSTSITENLIRLKKTTGMDGRFQVGDEKGQGVTIESIQKDGYEVEPDNCPHSFGALGGNFETPIIFKMWSTNIHERLITGGKSFDVVPDGRFYFINLNDDTISEFEKGDLKVWIQYTNQVVRGQLYSWSAGIEVINGGLQETKDYSMFSAPAESYAPSFILQGQIKGGQRGNIGERRFYFTLKGGQEYGRMTIEMIAPFNDQTPGLIRLSYAINPSGSRILR